MCVCSGSSAPLFNGLASYSVCQIVGIFVVSCPGSALALFDLVPCSCSGCVSQEHCKPS